MVENEARDVLVETRVTQSRVDRFVLLLVGEQPRLMLENDAIQEDITERYVHVPVDVVRQTGLKHRTEMLDVVRRDRLAVRFRRVQSDECG